MRRKHQYLWVITVQTGAKKICAIEPKRQRIFHKAVAVCWQFVGVFNGNFITTYCILQRFKTKNTEKPGSIWQSHREEYSDTVLTYSGQCLGFLHLSVDLNCQMSNKTNHNHHWCVQLSIIGGCSCHQLLLVTYHLWDWVITELRFHVPLKTKQIISETFPS